MNIRRVYDVEEVVSYRSYLKKAAERMRERKSQVLLLIVVDGCFFGRRGVTIDAERWYMSLWPPNGFLMNRDGVAGDARRCPSSFGRYHRFPVEYSQLFSIEK